MNTHAGLALVLSLSSSSGAALFAGDERPNVLWITSEDNGPHLGAYGDEYADTPHLDALAARGITYSTAWSNAPVCAPARTAIISGLYPTSTGSQHMRSMASLPEGLRMFPQYLRAAGYYCSNNSKEDYNLEKPGQVWDVSSGKAHWRGRRPGQPFFAVVNITVTHEGQIRKRPHEAVHDPKRVPLPAYHPDHPAVREDWAQYYDKLTEMDTRVGRILAELDEDGLRESTVVFYFGDHGPGMPRCKRWPYDSGLHVPLIVSVPQSLSPLASDYEAGERSERLVGFVDLAPTVLSLAGIPAPEHMHGTAFLGPHAGRAPRYLFGFRDRMDERYDLVRTVRDRRYVYVRNYMPHRIYGEHVAYMFQTPTTRIWKELHDRGELSPEQSRFWLPKSPEELYDLSTDPDEVRNLAGSAEHRDVLVRMRAAQRDHALRVRDLGFLPEADIHRRAGDRTPYELGRDADGYPLERILAAAELAASREAASPALRRGLGDAELAVRYWSATGLLVRGADAVSEARDELRASLSDDSESVRIVAAEALGRYGTEGDARAALDVLLAAADVRSNDLFVAIAALNALDALGDRALGAVDAIRELPREVEGTPQRTRGYVPRLLEKIVEDLAPTPVDDDGDEHPTPPTPVYSATAPHPPTGRER